MLSITSSEEKKRGKKDISTGSVSQCLKVSCSHKGEEEELRLLWKKRGGKGRGDPLGAILGK